MGLKKVIVFIFAILFVGCASIPPEAPELSMELGKRISSIEEANIKLLHKYFEQKREKVDEFIQEEWVPEFANNIFSTPRVANAWNIIVQENSKQDRLKLLITLGPKLQAMINKKRLEMIAPLDQLEQAIEQKIRQEYVQAKSINNSITGLLASVSKVSENRNRYLSMIGVSDEKIGKIIDETDAAVASLLKKSKNLPEKVEKANNFLQKIKKIKNSL